MISIFGGILAFLLVIGLLFWSSRKHYGFTVSETVTTIVVAIVMVLIFATLGWI